MFSPILTKAAKSTIAFLAVVMAVAVPCHSDGQTGLPLSAKTGLVLIDDATGDYLIWLDRGKDDNISSGLILDVSVNSVPAGSLWIDESLEHTSAGHLIPIAGCPRIKSGATLVFTKREPAVVTLMPEINIPGVRSGIAGAPGAVGEGRDKLLMGNFLKWTKGWATNTHEIADMPKVEKSAQPETAPAKKPELNAEIIELDPDMEYELKSSFFIESGDCLHIAPWPETENGHTIRIDKSLSFEFPGMGEISIKGKSISALEMELNNHFSTPENIEMIKVSPCKLRP